MRVPRFRLRTLMIAVAMAALGLGLWHRRETFNRVAEFHKSQVLSLKSLRLTHMDGKVVYSAAPERIPAGSRILAPLGGAFKGMYVLNEKYIDWHAVMESKYRYHASHPWLPVPPDLPEPPEPK